MLDTLRPPSRITAYAILFLAFALRLFRLDFQELRGDEAFGYFFSLRPYTDIVAATLSLREPHPVGSYFLQHLWLGMAGHSEFSLRFVSVWFGVLAVALLHRLARQMGFAPTTASTAALLLAVSPYAVWHSQDARMYSILAALTLSSTWLMVKALQGGGRPTWLLYVILSWLALHTHYFALFVLAAQNGFVLGRALLMPQDRSGSLPWVQWQIVLGLAYLPWLFVAAGTLTGYGGNGDSPGFWAMVQRSLAVFVVGESLSASWMTGVALGVGLFILLGAILLWRDGGGQRSTLVLLVFLWAIPVLITWASAQNRPIFNERYLIAAAPPFYLLLAAILTHAAPAMPSVLRFALRYLSPLLLFCLLLVSLTHHFYNPAYSKTRGWRELAAAFERFSAGLPSDQVRLAQNFPDPTIWYYYRGPVEHIVLPPGAGDEAGAAEVVAQLAASGVTRVILPIQPAAWWDDAEIASRSLAQAYGLTAQLPVGVWPLEIYSRPSSRLPLRSAQFNNGLRLSGSKVEPDIVTPGGLLTVYLAWDTQAAELSGSEKLFLHLLDAAGQIVSQTDTPFQPRRQAEEAMIYGLLLPEPLPPGPYRLIVGLYDPSQPAAPRIGTTLGTEFVELGVLSER